MEDNFVIGVLGGMGTYATIICSDSMQRFFLLKKNGRGRESLLIIGVQCQVESEHFYIMRMLRNLLMRCRIQ